METSLKTRLKNKKRNAILDAAVREFGSSGFDNTSMDRIAEVANVSKRTVYNHFPSKEDLFAAIVSRLNARFERGQEWPFSEDRTLDSQLLEIGESYAERVSSDDFQDLARVILPRFLQSPALSEQLIGDTTAVEQALIQWMEAARAASALECSDLQMAARQFLGMINAVVFWPQILSSKPPADQRQQKAAVRSAVALFLDHYARG